MKGITALVCAKQKIVKIYDGKTIKAIYPISIDIPKTKVEKEFSGYDWGAWSVSDRDYTYTKKVTVYDESVISDIRQKAIEYYKSKNVKPSPEETKK